MRRIYLNSRAFQIPKCSQKCSLRVSFFLIFFQNNWVGVSVWRQVSSLDCIKLHPSSHLNNCLFWELLHLATPVPRYETGIQVYVGSQSTICIFLEHVLFFPFSGLLDFFFFFFFSFFLLFFYFDTSVVSIYHIFSTPWDVQMWTPKMWL